jgi:hypothetical protein
VGLYVYVDVGAGSPHTVLYDNIFCTRADLAGIVAAPDGVLTRITTSLDFQRKVRFDSDALDLERFLDRVWEAKSVPFISVK